MIIYKVTNLINGKIYIGKTIQLLENRRKSHESNSLSGKLNYYFCNALRKYGIDSFKWETIDAAKTEQELNLLEQLYIEEYRLKGQIYNLNDGRGGLSGFNHSEETKLKMSEAKKGKLFTEEHKRKISEANKGQIPWIKGKNRSKECKKKISIGNKGKIRSEEAKRKMSEAAKDRKHTEETKLKMSESTKGNKHTKETRKKISEANKGNQNWLGKHHTDETKQKMSESGKAVWAKRNGTVAK